MFESTHRLWRADTNLFIPILLPLSLKWKQESSENTRKFVIIIRKNPLKQQYAGNIEPLQQKMTCRTKNCALFISLPALSLFLLVTKKYLRPDFSWCHGIHPCRHPHSFQVIAWWLWTDPISAWAAIDRANQNASFNYLLPHTLASPTNQSAPFPDRPRSRRRRCSSGSLFWQRMAAHILLTFIRSYIRPYVHLYMFIHTFIYTFIYTLYVYTYIYTYVYTNVCSYICSYICLYIYYKEREKEYIINTLTYIFFNSFAITSYIFSIHFVTCNS